MKKKLLLLVMVLTGLTSAQAANGTLSVTNMKNVVPGYSGSFDVVLSGADVQYSGFQFDLTLPEGISFADSFVKGGLLGTYSVVISEQGSRTYRFTGVANPVTDFTATNGTLLTIKYTTSSSATGTLDGQLSGIYMSNSAAASYSLEDAAFQFTVSDAVNLSEDDTEAPAATSGEVNVKVNRSFKANTWSTLVLPFPMTNAQLKAAFGDDVQLASFEGYTKSGDNISVSFVISSELEAHTPYIIKMSAAKAGFTVSGVTITEATNDLTVNKGNNRNPRAMIGTYSTDTEVPDYSLILVDNQFRYSKGNSKIKAFHAYFSFSDFDYEEAGAHFMLDVFDMTTGIRQINRDTGLEGSAYNLSGQKVIDSARGIQIKDGKKVIKK